MTVFSVSALLGEIQRPDVIHGRAIFPSRPRCLCQFSIIDSHLAHLRWSRFQPTSFAMFVIQVLMFLRKSITDVSPGMTTRQGCLPPGLAAENLLHIITCGDMPQLGSACWRGVKE